MTRRPRTDGNIRLFAQASLLLSALGISCKDKPSEATSQSAPSVTRAAPPPRTEPIKVERKELAMGTSVQIIAYTNSKVGATATHEAIDSALREIGRLEAILSEWREESDVGRINRQAGTWVNVSSETLEVLDKSLWAGRVSGGTFDITFQSMSSLWKFGSAQEAKPILPSAAAVARARARVDFRQVEVDREGARARIPKGRAIGLGGIAKGYIVDRVVAELRRAGLESFLVRAGGDLYGAGRKPDGSRWVSGVQDPRGEPGSYFASIELEDHAFSTAGDYARSFIVAGKRYHHILDPRTGYPASASRSVTVWAEDALTADIIDDAVFILGPERGLALAESIDGVGVVIVDANNRVWTSPRLAGKIRISKPPTDAP